MADIQSVLDSLIPQEVEVQTHAGAWYTMRILPYRTLDNVIEGAVITFADITEMKKTQDALRESRERFERLFLDTPVGIALIDSLTGHIRELNPTFATLAGRTLEELLDDDWMSITHPDDVQADLDNMKLLNAGTISGFHVAQRLLHRNGASVPVNMTVVRVKAGDEAHPHHLCMVVPRTPSVS